MAHLYAHGNLDGCRVARARGLHRRERPRRSSRRRSSSVGSARGAPCTSPRAGRSRPRNKPSSTTRSAPCSEASGGSAKTSLSQIGASLLRVVPFHRTAVFVEEDDGTRSGSCGARARRAQAGDDVPVGSRLRARSRAKGWPQNPATAGVQIVEDMATRTSPVRRRAARRPEELRRLPLVHGGTVRLVARGHDVVGAPSQHALPLLERHGRSAARRGRAAPVRVARTACSFRSSPGLPTGCSPSTPARTWPRATPPSSGCWASGAARSSAASWATSWAPTSPRALSSPADDPGAVSFVLPGERGGPVDAVVATVADDDRGRPRRCTCATHARASPPRKPTRDASSSSRSSDRSARCLASDLRADRCWRGRSISASCASSWARCARSERQPERHAAPRGLVTAPGRSSRPSSRAAAKPTSSASSSSCPPTTASAVPAPSRRPHEPPRRPTRTPRGGLGSRPHARAAQLGALLAVGHAGDAAMRVRRDVWDSIASTISVALHAADDYEQVVALEAQNRQLVDNLPVIVARFDPATARRRSSTAPSNASSASVRPDAVGSPGCGAACRSHRGRRLHRRARRRRPGHDTLWQERRYRHADGRVLTDARAGLPRARRRRGGRRRRAHRLRRDHRDRVAQGAVQSDRLASLGVSRRRDRARDQQPRRLPGPRHRAGRAPPRLGVGPRLRCGRPLREIALELGEASSRIAEIVGELKLFTRMSDGASRIPIDLNRVLQTALTLTSSEIKRRARLEVDISEVPLAPGRFANMGQVFVNLLINAAQAIDAKGAEGRPRERDPAQAPSSGDDAAAVVGARPGTRARCASRYQGGAAIVTVSDTGAGIAPRAVAARLRPVLHRPCEPRRRGPGARDLLRPRPTRRRRHPRQRAASARARPSRSSCRWTSECRAKRVAAPPSPAPPSPAVEPALAAPDLDVGAGKRRVLIIDDERSLVKALSRQLHDRYDVDTASTASEAFALFAANSYDAVVCDLRMPDQSGPDIYGTMHARASQQAMRFIFTTGGNYGLQDDELHQRASATGRPVLEKPFDGASFERVVSAVASGAGFSTRPPAPA